MPFSNESIIINIKCFTTLKYIKDASWRIGGNMYKIIRAEELTTNIYLMEVEAPRVAKKCEPGQFVIVRMDEEGERIRCCETFRIAHRGQHLLCIHGVCSCLCPWHYTFP